jgi:hypothetical protein
VSERDSSGASACIHTPARCNGGGYDGCACGPYQREDAEAAIHRLEMALIAIDALEASLGPDRV